MHDDWKNGDFYHWISESGYVDSEGSNSALIGWSEMEIGFDDLGQFKNEYLVDGSNDKSIDLIAFSEDKRKIYIVQSYYSDKPLKRGNISQSSKASDMAQGINWVFVEDLYSDNGVEKANKPFIHMAESVREALRDESEEEVSEIEIIYLHNRHEYSNVKHEMEAIRKSLVAILDKHYERTDIQVISREIGCETLEREFADYGTSMKVKDEIKFDLDFSGFIMKEGDWESYVTSLRSNDVNKLWKKYGSKLLSGNIRDYYGATRRKTDINRGIRSTLENNPENFAVYNNGITVLTNSYEVDIEGVSSEVLKVSGITVVNGGQTTGSIGSVDDPGGHVVARFIKVNSDNNNFVDSIVRYNNTQNPVIPADFRSSDATQTSLVEGIRSKYGDLVIYNGLRRGYRIGIPNSEKNKTIGDKFAAQALAAFRGHPNIAYNRTKSIWESNDKYNECYKNSTPENLVFVVGLLKAVESHKDYLSSQNKKELLSDPEKQVYDYFTLRGSTILLAYAISRTLESLLKRKIEKHQYYTIHFSLDSCKDLQEAQNLWKPIVEKLSLGAYHLEKATGTGMRGEELEDAIKGFRQFSHAVIDTDDKNIIRFKNAVNIDI